MEKIKFVMTDTDTQVSAVCRRALEAKGIAVTVCEKNGTKALETLLAVHPQAVLLDAFMPDLDAITVKQRYEAMLEQDPDDVRFKMLLDNWVAAKDHPTKEDLDNMAAAAKKAVLGE